MGTHSTSKPTGRKVMLMATCLCDTFYADVAKATVEVLESADCEVLFPENQTCCGQPAFNSGDFDTGRKIAKHTLSVFAGELPVIVPSGSCAAMLCHGNELQFEKADRTDQNAVRDLALRTWELCDFLYNGLRIRRWNGELPATRIAFHHACHTRGSGTGLAATELLKSIPGVELLPFGQDEQCCGFGGSFSVTFPHLSSEMGTLKLDHVMENKPDLLVSADMSCLMHLSGLAARNGQNIPIAHVSQLLRDSAKIRV